MGELCIGRLKKAELIEKSSSKKLSRVKNCYRECDDDDHMLVRAAPCERVGGRSEMLLSARKVVLLHRRSLTSRLEINALFLSPACPLGWER